MRITIFGASGFVGRHLTGALRARGDEVVAASLRDLEQAAAACAGSDAIVNLAGAPVAERWSDAHKAEIERTRTELPRRLIDALAASAQRPAAYVSASAIGYYGSSRDATFTETSPAGDGFLARVCIGWEREAERARDVGMRVTIVRTGLVLGPDGGALAKLLPVFKAGFGGIVASGEQWYSWIHIDDLVGIYLMALDGVEGVLNGTAPEPVRNREFTAALGAAVARPTLLPTPSFVLSALLGEGAMVITEGQRVVPQATLERGFRFRYSTITQALGAIVAT